MTNLDAVYDALTINLKRTKFNPNMKWIDGARPYFGTVQHGTKRIEIFHTVKPGEKDPPTVKDVVDYCVSEIRAVMVEFPKTEDWYKNSERRALETRTEKFAELLGADLMTIVLQYIEAI